MVLDSKLNNKAQQLGLLKSECVIAMVRDYHENIRNPSKAYIVFLKIEQIIILKHLEPLFKKLAAIYFFKVLCFSALITTLSSTNKPFLLLTISIYFLATLALSAFSPKSSNSSSVVGTQKGF